MSNAEETSDWTLDIRDLREGANAFENALDADAFATILGEVDELYTASSPCAVRLDVNKLPQMLHVTGVITGPYDAECARCLAPLSRTLEIQLSWTLLPAAALQDDLSAEDELELTTDDLDTSFYEGDEIDLRELVREAILLELDPIPRCDVDECSGSAYVQPPAESGEPATDPRWAPLLKWKDKSQPS